jgi:hypothetical protein
VIKPQEPTYTTKTDSHTSVAKVYLALGVGVICIGLSTIFVRWANAPGAVTSFYRMAIAVVAMAWPFFRRVKRREATCPVVEC